MSVFGSNCLIIRISIFGQEIQHKKFEIKFLEFGKIAPD